MEKATIAGGFFKLPALWGHASSGHTKTYELSIATAWLRQIRCHILAARMWPRSIDPKARNASTSYATLDASGKCADAACGLFFGGND
jgi:hypothetical protein